MPGIHSLWLVFVVSGVLVHAAGQQSFPVPATGDDAGFESIFDGKTLTGWEGDPKYWRVEDGCLVGEVTPETLLQQNSFIIWRGGVTRDFELKVEYRVSARGNSGINYRSIEVPGQAWALSRPTSARQLPSFELGNPPKLQPQPKSQLQYS